MSLIENFKITIVNGARISYTCVHSMLLGPMYISLTNFAFNHCSKIIWLGDLNYRLVSGDDTNELVNNNDWQALLEKDQV